MAQLRGVDILGQGVLNGIPGLADTLAKHFQDQQRRQELNTIVQGLLARSQGTPKKMGTDIGSLPIPAQAGTPMFSQQNFGDLQRMSELTGGKGPGLLQDLQPRTQFMPGFRGSVDRATYLPSGEATLKEERAPMPEKASTSSTSQKWYDVIGPDGKPEVGMVNGVKSKKQYTRAINPDTGQWEIEHQWVKYDQSAASAGNGRPDNQLVPLDQGYVGYNKRTNSFVPIQGETQYKLTPNEVKTAVMNLNGNLSSIKSIREVMNRASMTGPVTGRARQIGTQFYSDADATTLKNRLAQLRTVIYGLSGKQINESEQKWLENEVLPNMSNPSENFEVTLNEFEGWLKRRIGEIQNQFPGSKKVSPPTETSSGSKFKIIRVTPK